MLVILEGLVMYALLNLGLSARYDSRGFQICYVGRRDLQHIPFRQEHGFLTLGAVEVN